MIRLILALPFFCLASAFAQAQTFAPTSQRTPPIIEDATADQVLAARAISLLKRLDDDVIVYRSLGEFEESGKLARVSFETFIGDLREVTGEVQAELASMPESRAKIEMRNALASYQDGAFFWQRVYQPPVINVSSLSSTRTSNRTRTTPDTFLAAQTPYTVAIYWRQANKYLQRAMRQVEALPGQ